jgi:predicted transcriptional regulator
MEKPDLYVLARFLNILYKNGQPMKKTNIQMQMGLNYTRFTDYLDWLLAHGLVLKGDGGDAEVYGLSPRGLDSYHRLVDWIRDTMKDMKI